jgi:gliding motility-associated-like protein
VYVHHTENVPDDVTLCNVSVMPGDIGIELDWQPLNVSDLVGYIIKRKGTGSSVFTAIDTIWNTSISSYSDTSGVNPDAGSACYEVYGIDRCGRISLNAGNYCTVYLEGSAEGYASTLTWEQPINWPEGVELQEVVRNYPEVPGNPSQVIQILAPFDRSFQDRTILEPRNCYRILVLALDGGCGEDSWSNDVCLNFPPTLFVPTAFTPNGDGVNDYFTSFGEFEATFELQVWDRWGKLIFQANTPLPGWQGDFKGNPAPEGVYVYKIVVTGFDGQVLERNGSITLLR